VKNKILISAVLILAVLSLGTFTGVILSTQNDTVSLAATGTNHEDQNTLTVSGIGSVSLRPDIAQINAGVETLLKDAAEAQAENAKVMNRVIAALRAAGIAERDIQTSNYSVNVEYDWSGEQRRLLGYRVSNNVRVTIRRTEQVGAILTKMSEAGANNIHGINFTVENQAGAYDEALKTAIDQAKAKAAMMASQAGVRLGTPIAIVESGAPAVQFAKTTDMAMREQAAVQIPVMQGELEVQASVTIVFSIR